LTVEKLQGKIPYLSSIGNFVGYRYT